LNSYINRLGTFVGVWILGMIPLGILYVLDRAIGLTWALSIVLGGLVVPAFLLTPQRSGDDHQ
jgi:hypothetical protein